MDLAQFLLDELAPHISHYQQQHPEESRKLEERIQSHAIEIHHMENEVFSNRVYRRQLETSTKALNGALATLTRNMNVKLQHQNRVVGLVNAEQEKQKGLQRQTEAAMEKMNEDEKEIAEMRWQVDGFGEHAMKFHDSIQSVRSEISGLEEDMRKYREQEVELGTLNGQLVRAETELNETTNSIIVAEMQLAKSDMGNQKCQADIQQLSGRKEEVESSLVVHLDEKGKLQRELEGSSIQSKLQDKLDEIDVLLKAHTTTTNDIQTQHDEDMKVVQEETQKEVEQNEAFQKLLEEQDGSLAHQNQALDQAKGELQSLSDGSSRVNYEDPLLRPLELDLETIKCATNQTDEEIMHRRDQLSDDTSSGASDCMDEEDGTATGNGVSHSGANDLTHNSLAMTSMRTSTPNREAMVSCGGGGGGCGAGDNRSIMSFVSGLSLEDHRLSFASIVTQPTSTPPTKSDTTNRRRSQKRSSRAMLDLEVSSTQE